MRGNCYLRFVVSGLGITEQAHVPLDSLICRKLSGLSVITGRGRGRFLDLYKQPILELEQVAFCRRVPMLNNQSPSIFGAVVVFGVKSQYTATCATPLLAPNSHGTTLPSFKAWADCLP